MLAGNQPLSLAATSNATLGSSAQTPPSGPECHEHVGCEACLTRARRDLLREVARVFPDSDPTTLQIPHRRLRVRHLRKLLALFFEFVE
jgi:hypothetical protein